MKSFTYAMIALLTASSALAARVGDTYEQVIAEKGKPSSEVNGGDLRIVNYPDSSIRVKENLVVAIKTREEARGTAIHVVPKPTAVPVATPMPASAVNAKAKEPVVAESGTTWTTEYASAMERAKSENRNVFLFFTGSDWCGWCQRLDREVLSTVDFGRYANDKLVLVKLDFPRQVEQSDALKSQNLELARRFRIQGYPTVVVLDPSGKVLRRLGYQEGGPAPFLRALQPL